MEARNNLEAAVCRLMKQFGAAQRQFALGRDQKFPFVRGVCACFFVCLFGQGNLGILRCHTSHLLLVLIIDTKNGETSQCWGKGRKSTNVCDYL